MKVKLFVPICGPEGSFRIGDEPDLSDTLAQALIKDGHAKAIGVEKVAEVKTEIVPELEAEAEEVEVKKEIPVEEIQVEEVEGVAEETKKVELPKPPETTLKNESGAPVKRRR